MNISLVHLRKVVALFALTFVGCATKATQFPLIVISDQGRDSLLSKKIEVGTSATVLNNVVTHVKIMIRNLSDREYSLNPNSFYATDNTGAIYERLNAEQAALLYANTANLNANDPAFQQSIRRIFFANELKQQDIPPGGVGGGSIYFRHSNQFPFSLVLGFKDGANYSVQYSLESKKEGR
jgi:hypothetical protein